MGWLKDAFLDITVLVLALFFAVYQHQVLEIVIWVYTAMLLIGKALTFFMPSLQKRAGKTAVPDIFYHVIYLLMVALFIFISSYYLAAAWLIIWISSAVQAAKNK